MALRRALSKRLLLNYSSTKTGSTLSPFSSSLNSENAAVPKAPLHREYLTSPEFSKTGFFCRFLQQKRGFNQAAPTMLPEFLSLPVGEKLREKLRSINIPGDRLRFDPILPPSMAPATETQVGGISVADAKKILRSAQLEKLRLRLGEIPMNSISYSEYVKICGDACENSEQGLEFAKMLDDAGNVIVVGNVVFLRPDQVSKSVEQLISQSMARPNDPRRRELDQMEEQKAFIDQKAESLVRAELYCGLGILVLQTLGFMRLTFWELSWDVMEPICFFVTSLHFALAYGFFLRTSKEPSFEGYFQRRFRVKQRKLMKIHNFDSEKYNQLCRAFYPNNYGDQAWSKHVLAPINHARGAFFGSIHDG
ncbi:unnamed protein product [Coffea canephora]|uniref:DH200=94 genomic scaffold, scaffold_3699 n=1 Tax=Coffea canephora TaxID=49390 RepID=A0A068VNT9_COFCA|nr:unnamed protein product [Coffea canephora]